MTSAFKRTIVALDNLTELEINNFLERGGIEFDYFKIGLEVFCRNGPDYIREFYKKTNKKIFLDLKLHDIPNTVSKAIQSLEGLPIEFLTIHLAGGQSMLSMAREACEKYLPSTKLLGVSYLTSLGSEDMNSIWGFKNQSDIQIAFERLFRLACQTSIHGIILSPLELSLAGKIEQQNAHKLIKITPGIRFEDEIGTTNAHDQKRILDPLNALKNGADFLVMGRSLTSTKHLAPRIDQLKKAQLAQ